MSGINIPSSIWTSIVENIAVSSAVSALPNVMSGLLQAVTPHVQAAATASPSDPPMPDAAKKTMTIAWVQANSSLVPLYMMNGFTIVP